MWNSMPCFVRLAIEIVAGLTVLAAGLLLVWALLWLAGGVLGGPLRSLQQRQRSSEETRHMKHRKSLGYDQ